MNNTKPQKKDTLLIFDFDGTLIDSVPDLADAINSMLTTLGKDTYALDDIRNWVGNGSRLLVERALVGHVDVSKHDVSQQTVDDAEALFFEAYANMSGQKTQAYAGVDEGLHALKAEGYTLALVTNKPIRYVPKILQRFGWQQIFSAVLGGDSLPLKKPDPAPLLHVCDSLQFSPKQAVMIGDSKNDILAGQHAGMDTLALAYGYNYGQDIRDFDPTATFDEFAQLRHYIVEHYK